MATTVVGATLPTLLDVSQRLDPNGSIAVIAEMLTQRNPILQDAVFLEGNLPTGHRFTSRTALPSVTWRKYNQGVAPSKSLTDQVTEVTGMLVAQSQVDVELAKLNGNDAAFRASEDVAFISALSNELETGFIYHNVINTPEKFMGLSPRLAATSSNPAASQIVKWGGSSSGSDQTSIWLCSWSPDTVFAIYPKGSMAGLETSDMGIQLITDANSNRFRAYVTEWTWKVGLCVKDWRYLVRGCNIDTSAISGTSDDLVPMLVQMYSRLYSPNVGRNVFYLNRLVWQYFWLQARNNAKGFLTDFSNEIAGKGPVLSFLGIPMRQSDGIGVAEAVVS